MQYMYMLFICTVTDNTFSSHYVVMLALISVLVCVYIIMWPVFPLLVSKPIKECQRLSLHRGVCVLIAFLSSVTVI